MKFPWWCSAKDESVTIEGNPLSCPICKSEFNVEMKLCRPNYGRARQRLLEAWEDRNEQ